MIPRGLDAVVAFDGAHGNALRIYCTACQERHPLDHARPVTGAAICSDYACDACGVLLQDLVDACDRDHRAQQEAWARGAVVVLDEMGVRGDVLCRIL